MEREMSMAMVPRLSSSSSPSSSSSNMSSILVSTARKASRMLALAATVGPTTRGERWRVTDHIKYFVMLTAWVNVWILRVFMDLCSSSSSSSSSSSGGGGLPEVGGYGVVGMEGMDAAAAAAGAVVLHGRVIGQGQAGWPSSSTGIGRALSHILGILNEIPATSRKYELVLSMADKLITDNLNHRHVSIHDVTRSALSSAFSRTCELLRRSLQSVSDGASSSSSLLSTLPSRVLHLLPLGPHLAAGYDAIRRIINDPDALIRAPAPRLCCNIRAVAGPNGSWAGNEWVEAEKLAHELLWITNKMRACSMAGDAIVKWGFANGLASLVITAHPRVQGPILKISAMLFRELAHGEWEVAREVRFQILLVWLPVLCYASNGLACPVLMAFERWEVEMVVEDVIFGLPWEDQEVILRNWVEDFAATDSDWPNLKRCFERWCRNSRKHLL